MERDRKVSVEQCKKMLNKNDNNYTDEEIERDYKTTFED